MHYPYLKLYILISLYTHLVASSIKYFKLGARIAYLESVGIVLYYYLFFIYLLKCTSVTLLFKQVRETCEFRPYM